MTRRLYISFLKFIVKSCQRGLQWQCAELVTWRWNDKTNENRSNESSLESRNLEMISTKVFLTSFPKSGKEINYEDFILLRINPALKRLQDISNRVCSQSVYSISATRVFYRSDWSGYYILWRDIIAGLPENFFAWALKKF